MGGIGGLYYLDGRPVESFELAALGQALKHRGPQGIHQFKKDSVGLITCVLHDSPESSTSKLPLSSRDGNLTIFFHGRIDNRQELAKTLPWHLPLHATADGALVLESYHKWGDSCPEKLRGDFAFAIWDAGRQTLFCARDLIGIKPFYYHLSTTCFVFASEIKGVLSSPLVSRRLNELRLADYLTVGVTDKDSTFYSEIKRLPPGHFLQVNRSTHRLHCYSSLQPLSLNYRKDETYEEHFHELFSQAVQDRCRTTGDVAGFLSGGIDSSSVVSMAASLRRKSRITTNQIHVFSGRFATVHECDEGFYIDAVLQKYPELKPHSVLTDKLDAPQLIQALLDSEDEPFIGPHVFMIKALFEAIHNQGITVVLDGHDGDAALSHGTGYLYELAASARFFELYKNMNPLHHISPKDTIRTILKIYRDLLIAHIPPLRRMRTRRKAQSFLKHISLTFAKSARVHERIFDFLRTLPVPGDKEKERHLHLITQPIHSLALETLERLASYHQVAIRFPFFDKRVIEFCLGLPSSQKLRNGLGRNIIRRALHSELPEQIKTRMAKNNFAPSVKHMYLQRYPDWLISEIDAISQKSYKYIDQNFVERAKAVLLETSPNLSTKSITKLLLILIFSKWHNSLQSSHF